MKRENGKKTNKTKRIVAHFMAEFQMPSNLIYEPKENDKNIQSDEARRFNNSRSPFLGKLNKKQNEDFSLLFLLLLIFFS